MSLQNTRCWLLLPRQPSCPRQGSPSLLETSPGSNLGLASISSASVRLACLGPLGWWCEGFALPAGNSCFTNCRVNKDKQGSKVPRGPLVHQGPLDQPDPKESQDVLGQLDPL